MPQIFRTYAEKLEDVRWEEKRHRILCHDNFKCRMCGTSSTPDNTLQVHHRYYIYNTEPWEYADSALITLCKNCHNIVHRTIAPLMYYKKNGQFSIMNFTPCTRCNGRGYMEEYRNVQNGMCFRCHGQRYEELINTETEISIDSYLANDEVFDCEMTLSEEESHNKFEEAKNYHLGRFGFKYDKDKALNIYMLAALGCNPQAQNNLAIMLEDRATNNYEYLKALRWYVYAGIQGVYQAQNNIGRLLSEYFVGKDKELVNYWMRLSERNKPASYELDVLENILNTSKEALIDMFALKDISIDKGNYEQEISQDVMSHINSPKKTESDLGNDMNEEELDAFIREIEEEHARRECEYQAYSKQIANSWPLLGFAKVFGKMQVGEFKNKETGELFHSCIFTKPDGKRTFVAFDNKLGELTPKEIAAMKNELFVVLRTSGNYVLCKRI